jgi:hypothetical protein
MWMKLQEIGAKYLLKTGGLDYQRLVRVENPPTAFVVLLDYGSNYYKGFRPIPGFLLSPDVDNLNQ